MSNNISLTIPRDDDKALIAGATMLLTLAGKVPEMELDNVADEVVPPAGTPAGYILDGKGDWVPPPAAAETATTTPPPADNTEVPGVTVDKNGLPWDARIHAGTKALLADGAWRYKQGVDRAILVPQVEEELRTLMATTTGATGTTTPPPAETTTPPPATNADGPTTFPEFLKAVSGLIAAGTTTMDTVNEVLNRPEFGVATIQLVNSVPTKIPAIWAALVGSGE